MSDRIMTVVLMGIAALLAIIWDIYVVFFNKEKRDSISEWMKDLSQHTLVIPFAWGALGGHFFWPGEPLFGWTPSFLLLLGIGLVWGFLQLAIPAIRDFKYRMIVSMVIGTICGHLLWPL